PMPDFRVHSTIRGGASESMSSRYSHRSHGRKTATSTSVENRRVVRQAMVCAGSLRVRSCKLLWKPVVLQLIVTTTTSLGEDEAHFDDCDDDSSDSDDDDINKLTTMARPNKSHHYSLVFCHRSFMGHARRERIDLDNTRDPVEFVWGEDGLLSTRFEFSIVYGKVGTSGRRRTLTCRARDAKEYLQWTDALRMVMEYQTKHKGAKVNRLTHANTLASSKASSNPRGSMGSFFDAEVVEEQQQLLEQDAARKRSAPTSPTAATAAKAIAPPDATIAKASALKPVPADIAAEYEVDRRRRVSVVVKPTPRPAGTRLQRRKPSADTGKPNTAPLRRSSTSRKAKPLPPFNKPFNTRGSKRSRRRMSISEPEEKRPRVPSSVPVLGAVPMLQSPSSISESPLDFVDSNRSVDSRTTEFVNSLVKIAAVVSARQRQKLLQHHRKESRHTSSYKLPLMSRSSEDPCLKSCRSSRLNFDMCDFEDVLSSRSNRRTTHTKSWNAYLKAMECEL
ncbi:hypothetical protein PHMEG_0003200, partial [Phytophthora megakarya]